jgi:CheY-like chemotaxis protein
MVCDQVVASDPHRYQRVAWSRGLFGAFVDEAAPARLPESVYRRRLVTVCPHGSNRLLRVLLVDDDMAVHSFVRDALRGDAQVIGQTTCCAAFEIVQTMTFDVLVLDLLLGWGDGLALLRQIAPRLCPRRVIAFTAWQNGVPEARRLGVTAVVKKPCMARELRAAVLDLPTLPGEPSR